MSPSAVAGQNLCMSTVAIGLVYKAYPDGCRHALTFLPRLRPYPMRRHRLLWGSVPCIPIPMFHASCETHADVHTLGTHAVYHALHAWYT